MAKKKTYYYVLVMTNYGPVFVTKVYRKTAEWQKDKAPLELSKEWANDIALGLTLNGYPAFVVAQPWEVEMHPYRYEIGEFKWEKKEAK